RFNVPSSTCGGKGSRGGGVTKPAASFPKSIQPLKPYCLILFIFIVLTACTTQAPATATQPATVPTLISAAIPESEWDTIELIAQAEQLSAPSFVDIGDETIFTWSGSPGAEARHF